MKYAEIMNLPAGAKIDHLLNNYIMKKTGERPLAYSTDPTYLLDMLGQLKKQGIHVNIQSIIEGYRVSWGNMYDEIYTDNLLEGVCKIGLLAYFDEP